MNHFQINLLMTSIHRIRGKYPGYWGGAPADLPWHAEDYSGRGWRSPAAWRADVRRLVAAEESAARMITRGISEGAQLRLACKRAAEAEFGTSD